MEGSSKSAIEKLEKRDRSLYFELNSGRIKKREGGIAKSPKGRLPMVFWVAAWQR